MLALVSIPPPYSPPTLEYSRVNVVGEHLRVRTILVDVAILFGLTFFGGFVVGFAAAASSVSMGVMMAALAVSNMVLLTIGFVLSGCRSPRGKRWPHLAWVALGIWLVSFLNVLFLGVSLGQWIGSAVLMVICMLIGGGLSMFIRRDDRM
jgi:hypothetical protein